MISANALIALGGNVTSSYGSPGLIIAKSLSELASEGVTVHAKSQLYKTPCFPPGAGDDFINSAAHVAFAGSARELLCVLHRVEARFGRVRNQRWSARTLDIDLLAVGDEVLPDEQGYHRWRCKSLSEQMNDTPDELILPHPRLHERGFVLVPLNDLAPDWCHPVLGKTVAEMLAALTAEELKQIVPHTP